MGIFSNVILPICWNNWELNNAPGEENFQYADMAHTPSEENCQHADLGQTAADGQETTTECSQRYLQRNRRPPDRFSLNLSI